MRRWSAWLLALAIAVPGACSDDPTNPREEVEEEQEEAVNNVAFMRLIIGSTTIVINRQGTVIGNPVVIGVPGAGLTATFLDANSQPVTLSPTDFRLDVTPDASARVTFTRTGPFTGSFTRNAAGAAMLEVRLFHLSRNHTDFGPASVPVTVQ